jgi:PAS domain S-box-containing protein
VNESVSRAFAPAEPESALLRLVGALSSAWSPDRPAADEQSYREFCEALGVALYTTDAAGRITFYNEAAAQLWGRRPELGEEWCGSWHLFWPDGRPMAHEECPMATAIKERRPIRGAMAIASRPDGTSVAFEPYPTPLLGRDGELLGAVNVLVDVTERQRAETALRASAAALEASNAVKDEFLGLISHELRTPVTTIYGNAQLLRERGRRYAADQQADMIADVAEDSERLLGIIENLLLLSRLQAGLTVETEPQVLHHVVAQEVEAFRRRHPGTDIQLTASPARHLVVEADRTLLIVLLQNLLSNAVKYGPADAPIEVRIDDAEGEARLRVLDRGFGFGDVDPASLFTPFFRTPEAQSAASGIGLGLAVCERIVRALGGRIWASSRDGGGSEFGIALPLAPDPVDEA